MGISGNVPHDQSEEHRRANLRAAGFSHARYLLAGDNFDLVADRLRRGIPGFSREEYQEALERGLIRAEEEQEQNLRYRRELIENARSEPLLDAVFMLRHHTFKPIGGDRLGPINVRKALGDLHSPKEIQDAVRFTKRLLEAGQRCDLAETGASSRLEREYPGFSKHHYLQAADLGWWMTR